MSAYRNTLRRILLALLCVTAVCCLPVSAKDTLLTAAEAVLLTDAQPLVNEITVDDFTSRPDLEWIPATGVQKIDIQEKNRSRYLSVHTDPSSGGICSIMGVFAENSALNLMTQTHFRFPLFISAEADQLYTVRLTLYSGLDTLTAETDVYGGEWISVSAEIADWHLRTRIHMCEITVLCGDSPVSGFFLGEITAGGQADLEIADAFLTFGFDAEGGRAEYRDGVYQLNPGSDGVMTLLASAVRSEYRPGSGISAVRVVLDNALEGGVISLAVSESGTDDASFTISSTCPIYYGENTYLLPYNSALALGAYRLRFHSLYPDAAESVTLRSVSLVSFPAAGASAYPARLSVCGFDEKGTSLTVSGTLSASLAAEYIDARLALVEIPMWQSAEQAAQNEPVLTMKMSTRFTFTLPLGGRQHLACASRYQVVILTDTQQIPVTAAIYPKQAATAAKASQSAVGLYGADNGGIFDSNASSVIIDVYADRLLGGAEGNISGRLCVRGGRNYYLDNAYIRELDGQIQYCLAADVEVYLRLLCATDLSKRKYTVFSPDADFYAFDVHTEEGASMLGAVTDFLASRYRTVSGFIAGMRLESARYNGADMSDENRYASLCADTLRLIYNSAVQHIPGVFVIAPVGHLDEGTNTDAVSADPVLLACRISRQIREEGEMPWGLLYISDAASEALGHTLNILSQMRVMNCALPHASLLLWQPPAGYAPDILLAEYEERCIAASRAGIRVLFLSVNSFSAADRAVICDGLKYTLDTTTFRRPLTENEAQLLTEKPIYRGWYTLSDFTDSYGTKGWIAGSGCSRLLTDTDGRTASRSLHAVFDPTDGNLFSPVSGNILCISGVTDNLTHAPHVVYSLQVTTQLESTDTAELTFIFGSGDARAEYSVTVPVGVPVDILCDLSTFPQADTVDFSAISLRCASAAALDITRISCCSSQFDSSSLAQMYRYRSISAAGFAETDKDSFSAAQKMVVGVMILGSVLGLALFSRRGGKIR